LAGNILSVVSAKMNYTPMPFTWLHISDFHIRGGDPYDRDVVLKALVRSVKEYRKKGRKPDMIFATGDIAYGGKSSEYCLATLFFDAILDAAGLNRPQLFVVPGNHDVDRDQSVGLTRSLETEEESYKYFKPGNPKGHIIQKLGAFRDWYNNYFDGIRKLPDDTTSDVVHVVDIRDQRIAVLQLNSALFSLGGDEDYNKLVLGRRCLQSAIEKIRNLEVDIKIGLLHHPLDWLCAFERSNIQSGLQGVLDILLRGHLHDTEVVSVISADGTLLYVGAGAAYQGREWPQRAMYCTFDSGQVTIFPIRYEDHPNEIWTVDPSVFPNENNYEKSFVIPRFTHLVPLSFSPVPLAHHPSPASQADVNGIAISLTNIEKFVADFDLEMATSELRKIAQVTKNNALINNVYAICAQLSFLSSVKNLNYNDVNNGTIINSILSVSDKIKKHFESDYLAKNNQTTLFNNLPAPMYSEFIMRSKPFDEVILGLQGRLPIVLIISMGGMGKTSIAYEIASRYIKKLDNGTKLRFDCVVWVCDYENQGNTDVNNVLDEIAITLRYSEFTRLPIKEKEVEIKELLKKYKVLLVIDNYETITDLKLSIWLRNIPEPSKVLITSRKYNYLIINQATIVDLKGMETNEAYGFIKKRLEDLGIPDLYRGINDFDDLIKNTGGNPKAINIALGYIKYECKTLPCIIKNISEAQDEELFDSLFGKCWALLNDKSKDVLLALSLFPFGVHPAMLSYVSGITNGHFEDSKKKLIELSLISVQYQDIYLEPIFYLEPLVQSFAKNKLKSTNLFEKDIRCRWLDGYMGIAKNIGFCWNEIEKLRELDVQCIREGIESAVNWAFQNEQYDYVISLTYNIRYYYYVRGFWSTKNNLIRAEAARKIQDIDVEFEALVYHINIASKQECPDEVDQYLLRLDELSLRITNKELLIGFNHSKALYYLSKGEYEKSQRLWKDNIDNNILNEHDLNANLRWLAISYYKNEDFIKAREILNDFLDDSKKNNFKRSELSARIYIAHIDIRENNIFKLGNDLELIKSIAEDIGDNTNLADIDYLFGEYYLAINNIILAKKYLSNAEKGYERLKNKVKVGLVKKLLLRV
jgi:predicted phosphodiesterase